MSGAGGRWVSLADYPRRTHLGLFRDYADPYFSVTTTVDVTALYQRTRAADGPSFFLATMFASLQAANAVPAFRQRLRPDGLWEHARVDVGGTVLRADETFGFVTFPWEEDFDAFHARGRAHVDDVRTSTGFTDHTPERDDLVYHSVLPWISFTAFKNARRGAGESVPKVVFGRHGLDGGRRRLPVAVEVHHALADGLHVARYLEHLQAGLGAWESDDP